MTETVKTYAELQEILQAKANYGFTHAGSAIVDMGWFNQSFELFPYSIIGAILIFTIEETYKCYLGNAVSLDDVENAKFIAKNGCKLPVEVAIALFPKKFEASEYDKQC